MKKLTRITAMVIMLTLVMVSATPVEASILDDLKGLDKDKYLRCHTMPLEIYREVQDAGATTYKKVKNNTLTGKPTLKSGEFYLVRLRTGKCLKEKQISGSLSARVSGYLKAGKTGTIRINLTDTKNKRLYGGLLTYKAKNNFTVSIYKPQKCPLMTATDGPDLLAERDLWFGISTKEMTKQEKGSYYCVSGTTNKASFKCDWAKLSTKWLLTKVTIDPKH